MSYKITGSGCYVPTVVQKNNAFLGLSFLDNHGTKFNEKNETIIDKFNSITGIEARKYINSELKTSDIAHIAAQKAIEDAKVDPDTIDYIILLKGDVTLILDEEEVKLKPHDVVVQRGTNHAWVNNGTEPALLIAVLIDKELV